MSQRIVTVCDAHMRDGDDDVAGTTYRVAIGTPDGRLRMFDIDVCVEHGIAFADLAAFVNELGRPVDPTTGEVVTSIPASVESTDGSSEAERSCPCCPRVSKNVAALRAHVRNMHGMTLSMARGTPGDHVCPECGDSFDTPMGIGAHRARKHGVESQTRLRREERERTDLAALSPTAAAMLVPNGTSPE
jgi:hypothetical protein